MLGQKSAIYPLRTISICLAIMLFAGPQESTAKETVSDEAAGEPGYMFYPALPNPPRIQYLTTFSSSKDLKTKKKESSFLKFILGDEIDADLKSIVKPYGVAVSEGLIYVVDSSANGYAVFDLQKQEFNFVQPSGAGSLSKPINITIDSDGTKYITDTIKMQILVYSKENKFLRAIGTKDQFKPVDVAIDGNRLFVSDIQHHQIQVIDKTTGDLISTFSGPGSGEDQLFHPTNISISEDKLLYISDMANFRIQVFTLEGEHVKSISNQGVNVGQLARPKGIALDRDENLYVVDAAFENVQIFGTVPDISLLMFFGGPATNHPSGMILPADIAINYESVEYFQQYAAPKFQLEYVILVSNQFGRNKVNVFGFGKMEGMSYQERE